MSNFLSSTSPWYCKAIIFKISVIALPSIQVFQELKFSTLYLKSRGHPTVTIALTLSLAFDFRNILIYLAF